MSPAVRTRTAATPSLLADDPALRLSRARAAWVTSDDDAGFTTLVTCLLLALLAHAAFAFALPDPGTVAMPTRVTEVEIVPAPPPAPDPIPEPLEPPAAPAARAPEAAAQMPPAAARAGALLTAKPSPAPPSAAEAPIAFVTDPNGTSYGSGVVARGGQAEHGQAGAVASGAVGGTTTAKAAPLATAPAPRGDVLVPAADLAKPPRLTEPDACRGFYPAEATDDAASATITLVVRATGEVASVSVLAETPAGQGFGQAAKRCLRAKRFSAALDRQGNAVSAATTLNVRFSR